MKPFSELELNVTVPGTNFTLEVNKTYRIVGRANPDGPPELRKIQKSKYPNPYNTEGVRPTYFEDLNLWDTGLTLNSPCYKLIKGDTKKRNEVYEKMLVLKQYLEDVYPENALSHKGSNQYFDEHYVIQISEPITITTDSPQNFYGLFLALVKGQIAPENEAENVRYNQLRTSYRILNKNKKVDEIQKLEYERSKAAATVIGLLESNKKADKEFLFDLFTYCDLRISSKTSEEMINLQFKNYINNKNNLKNAPKFNEFYEKFKTKKGKEELHTYKVLKECADRGLIRYDRTEYYIGEKSVGSNLKKAAEVVNNTPELKTQLIELYDSATYKG